MNILKKLLYIAFISILLLNSIIIPSYAVLNDNTNEPLKIGVFLNNFNDNFIYTVKTNLEDIQKENENKVQFTFFDAKGNQTSQNESIDKALNDDFDAFVINPISTNIDQLGDIPNKIAQKNIPLILYYANSPSMINFVKNYHNAVIIDTDVNQSGNIEGKILADAWNTDKETFDKNKDNVMQYIMLKGPANSPETISRTKYSIQAINEAGIKTEALSSIVCNWDEECAETSMDATLLKFGNNIEAIISNNDSMAIGAIKTLQKYGYNKGDSSKYIPVVGIDALPEAKELVNQGTMTGTVVQNPQIHANAIYTIVTNLALGNPPLSGTDYKFDETGTIVKLPYEEYIKQ